LSGDILLHICCAPCATAVVKSLRKEGLDPSGYFFNPSIHPWKELQRRADALRIWATSAGLSVEIVDEYPLEENLRMLLAAENRCSSCFQQRMNATAAKASALGVKGFTTTLLVSPYQNRELVGAAAFKAAELHGVEYFHRDFTPLYKETIRLSREAGLYRQPYCGCVFSERDRYLKMRSPGEK